MCSLLRTQCMYGTPYVPLLCMVSYLQYDSHATIEDTTSGHKEFGQNMQCIQTIELLPARHSGPAIFPVQIRLCPLCHARITSRGGVSGQPARHLTPALQLARLLFPYFLALVARLTAQVTAVRFGGGGVRFNLNPINRLFYPMMLARDPALIFIPGIEAALC